jgi:hypothetical protein
MWRTARFGIVGASLHGPLFYTGFRIFEARFGKSTSMKTVSSVLCIRLSFSRQFDRHVQQPHGQLAAQWLEAHHSNHAPWPYTPLGFSTQYRRTPIAASQIFSKVVTNHCTLFPAFFAYMGLLEGCSSQQVQQRFQDLLLPTMATGATFWPLLNVVNFKYVPQPYTCCM